MGKQESQPTKPTIKEPYWLSPYFYSVFICDKQKIKRTVKLVLTVCRDWYLANLYSLKVKVAELYLTLCHTMDWMKAVRLLCPWNFPGKNTGVSCHFLLQGIFLTKDLNLCLFCLLCWQAGSLPVNHLGLLSVSTQSMYVTFENVYFYQWRHGHCIFFRSFTWWTFNKWCSLFKKVEWGSCL